jgi:hypothetical protein
MGGYVTMSQRKAMRDTGRGRLMGTMGSHNQVLVSTKSGIHGRDAPK